MSFDEKWRKNENVMLILNAITLFTPMRTNIYDASAISNYQQEYYNVLRRYGFQQVFERRSQKNRKITRVGPNFRFILKNSVHFRSVSKTEPEFGFSVKIYAFSTGIVAFTSHL